MKLIITTCFTILLCIYKVGYSQESPIEKVCYSYEGNGNRITRSICTLKICNIDSTFQYYDLQNNIDTGETKKKLENIKVFPNPTKDVLNIKIVNGQSLGNVQIVLLSIIGQEVLRDNINSNNFVINLVNYPIGTYILCCKTAKGTRTWKIIREE